MLTGRIGKGDLDMDRTVVRLGWPGKNPGRPETRHLTKAKGEDMFQTAG